jgi:hypothetical protein
MSDSPEAERLDRSLARLRVEMLARQVPETPTPRPGGTFPNSEPSLDESRPQVGLLGQMITSLQQRWTIFRR